MLEHWEAGGAGRRLGGEPAVVGQQRGLMCCEIKCGGYTAASRDNLGGNLDARTQGGIYCPPHTSPICPSAPQPRPSGKALASNRSASVKESRRPVQPRSSRIPTSSGCMFKSPPSSTTSAAFEVCLRDGQNHTAGESDAVPCQRWRVRRNLPAARSPWLCSVTHCMNCPSSQACTTRWGRYASFSRQYSAWSWGKGGHAL